MSEKNRMIKNRKKLVLDLISSKNYVPMRMKDMAVLLSVPAPKRHELKEILQMLVDEGSIELNVEGRYEKNRVADPGNSRKVAREVKGSRGGRTSKDLYGKKGREQSAGRKSGKGKFGDKAQEKKEKILTLNLDDVVKAFGIPEEFPDKVLAQAERCPETVIPGDFYGRTDLRDVPMVTIDGEDARDLDDAVSLAFDGEYYVLGVHIADVSNYVQAGSALDQEALYRGTSVYLPDRVIPMLPKRLSNGICSLNAGEDRLAMTCMMQIDKKGRIRDHKIAETVINVNERMTYTAVDAILAEPELHPDLMERYKDYVDLFLLMRELSALLRANRKLRGAIDFDFPESKVTLDAEGNPIEIKPHLATTATRIIEDFMLAANETVAKEYSTRGIPFLYRIHEEPDRDKMEETLSFVRKQGIPVEKRKADISPAEVNKVLEAVQGDPREPLISRLMLRSMSKAVYSEACSGHFGLAAEYYCHFTSPIRRYPDLQIHRIIRDDLRGRLDKGNRLEKYKAMLPGVAVKTSALEVRAAETEREAVKLKKAEYMLEHIGEEFDGVISGVTSWGLYVELPNTIEGLVHIISLPGDYYLFDEDNYCLVGKRSGKVYTMGQPVRVRVKYAEVASRIVDFVLVEG